MDCEFECLSHLDRALTDRMKSTGDTGEACGRPVLQLLRTRAGPATTASHVHLAVAELRRGVITYQAETVVLSLHES